MLRSLTFTFPIALTLCLVAPRAARGDSCSGTAVTSCSGTCNASGASITCDLTGGTSTTGANHVAIYNSTSGNYECWGTDGVGSGFCCEISSSGITSITVDGTAHADTVYFTHGSDWLTNGGAAVTLSTYDGADIIHGSDGAGAETLQGGDGNDTIYSLLGDDVVAGEGGDDTIYLGGGDDVCFGGAGDDYISGDVGVDEIHGGAGADDIEGGGGDDYLFGDGGDDILNGDANDDQIWGGADDDILCGGDGADTLWGGPNDDDLWGPDAAVSSTSLGNGGGGNTQDVQDRADNLSTPGYSSIEATLATAPAACN